MRHFATFVLCGSLAAQGPIYVVDASNGPGTHYTQIQAAVVAVPGGSTLVVRPGSYAPVTIDAKAITILGTPGATFVDTASAPWLYVRNTAAAQTVTVRGLRAGSGFETSMSVENAAGPVTIDGVGAVVTSASWGTPVLVVTGSSQVDIRDWSLSGAAFAEACTVDNSTVVFERCTLRGGPAFAMSKAGGPAGEAALAVTNSRVQLVHTEVYGGSGAQYFYMGQPHYIAGGPGVQMSASTLRAMGLPTHVLMGGVIPAVAGTQPAIVGTGVARVEPQIPLLAPTGSGIVLTRPQMPSLLATSAVPGGTMTVERHGPAGVLTAVAISLRAPASSLPPLPDPLWLDGASLVVEAAGVTAISPFVVTKLVPSVPALVGFQCVWQAADLDATGLLAVSNPSPSFVR